MVSVKFTPLGAGQDVGRSCLLLTFDDRITIMFDCGAHITDKTSRVPDSSRIPDNLKAILVTHYHIDHVGGLPHLTQIDEEFKSRFSGSNAPEVIMTLPTKVLSPLVAKDFSRGSNQDLYFPIHIERAFSKVRTIGLHQRYPLALAPEVFVTPVYAGHVLGAVMYIVEYRGVTVMYTGDYSFASDSQLDGAKIPPTLLPSTGVDLIISESTYATSIRESPEKRAAKFVAAVEKTLEAGGVVLVPVFAIGRSQELSSIIRRSMGVGVKLYSTNDSSLKANPYFRLLKSWWENEGIGLELPDVEVLTDVKLLRKKSDDKAGEGTADNPRARPCVVFASPSMLEGGSSLEVFNEIVNDENSMVLLTGYCFKGTVGNKLIMFNSKRTRKGDRVVQLGHGRTCQVKCQIDYVPFTGHTDSVGIKEVMRIAKPRNIILIHGEADKMGRLAKELADEHNVDVKIPVNYEELRYEFSGLEHAIQLPEDGPSIEDILDGLTDSQYRAGLLSDTSRSL